MGFLDGGPIELEGGEEADRLDPEGRKCSCSCSSAVSKQINKKKKKKKKKKS